MATSKKPAEKKSATKPSTGRQKPAEKKSATKSAANKPSAGRQPSSKKSLTKMELDDLQYLTDHLTQLMGVFLQDHESGDVLTAQERRRLMGAGVRNYGFIEKALDVARDNPEMFPANFTSAQFAVNVHMLDAYRQLFWVLEKFEQAANEAMLIRANASMRDALRVYNVLKELTHSRVRGAEPLFRALNRFFARPRHPEMGEEPTIKELERDFNKAVHGKLDGEVAAKSVQPRVSGGVREVIDNVHKDKSAFKGTAEGEIEE